MERTHTLPDTPSYRSLFDIQSGDWASPPPKEVAVYRIALHQQRYGSLPDYHECLYQYVGEAENLLVRVGNYRDGFNRARREHAAGTLNLEQRWTLDQGRRLRKSAPGAKVRTHDRVGRRLYTLAQACWPTPDEVAEISCPPSWTDSEAEAWRESMNEELEPVAGQRIPTSIELEAYLVDDFDAGDPSWRIEDKLSRVLAESLFIEYYEEVIRAREEGNRSWIASLHLGRYLPPQLLPIPDDENF